MELGHLLTRSGLTYPEVSSKVYHDSFCQLGSSVSLPRVIYFEAFCLYAVSINSKAFKCRHINKERQIITKQYQVRIRLTRESQVRILDNICH